MYTLKSIYVPAPLLSHREQRTPILVEILEELGRQHLIALFPRQPGGRGRMDARELRAGRVVRDSLERVELFVEQVVALDGFVGGTQRRFELFAKMLSQVSAKKKLGNTQKSVPKTAISSSVCSIFSPSSL